MFLDTIYSLLICHGEYIFLNLLHWLLSPEVSQLFDKQSWQKWNDSYLQANSDGNAGKHRGETLLIWRTHDTS